MLTPREAFGRAYDILIELEAMGIEYPSFEIYSDSSATLWLGYPEDITEEQYNKACELMHSVRFPIGLGNGEEDSKIGISSCQGLMYEKIKS